MTPANAILLTLLVPGAAHGVLGRPVRGAIAFVVTVGMFFAGYAIVGDRLFHGLLFEPFDLLAVGFKVLPLNLLPEAPNLGCSMIATWLRDLPENPAMLDEALRKMRFAVPMEHLAFFLTSSSGILACLWAADAQSLALHHKPRRINRALAAGCSWMLPGSGHYLAGHKHKGMLLGAAVILMFVLGMLFSHGTGVDRGHHNAYWICQPLFGGGTLVAAFGFGQLEIPNPIPLRYSLGYTLTAIAGLMNLVVIIDAYTVVDRGESSEGVRS